MGSIASKATSAVTKKRPRIQEITYDATVTFFRLRLDAAATLSCALPGSA